MCLYVQYHNQPKTEKPVILLMLSHLKPIFKHVLGRGALQLPNIKKGIKS